MKHRTVVCLVVGVFCVALFSCKKHKPETPKSFVGIKAMPEASFASVKAQQVASIARHYPDREKVAPVPRAPMSLTASDGTGLQLVSLIGKAVVQGPLAFTELHLVFHNPEARQREGRFSITLPDGAAISRLAMKLPTGWQEAEVVERQAARQIYEDFLHRRQDPALLEKKAGNEFRARIFPIPPSADKEIIISYSQKLASTKTPYTLPLRGLPKMRSLSLAVFVNQQKGSGASSLGGVSLSQQVIKVDKQDYAPDRDFEVPATTIAGLRHGEIVAARISPSLPQRDEKLSSLVVLVDTSASRAAGFYRQVEQLGALITHLRQRHGGGLKLLVGCFDQVVSQLYEGSAGGFGQAQLDAILARRPLGASDLHAALAATAGVSGYDRLLLVTDGIATAGETKPEQLRRAVKALRSKIKRLDVLLVGGIRDVAGMQQLARGNLERDGVVLDGTLGGSELAQRISRPTLSGIEVAVEGAEWAWPKRLDGLQPGDSAIVFATLRQGVPAGPLTINLSGPLHSSIKVALAEVKQPLLERAFVEARIANLQRQAGDDATSPDLRAAIKKQIVGLSIKHRVLSDYTALLVLETEADYRRYGIERTSLSNIMVVGAGGIELQHRQQVAPQPPPPPRPPMPSMAQPTAEGDVRPRRRAAATRRREGGRLQITARPRAATPLAEPSIRPPAEEAEDKKTVAPAGAPAPRLAPERKRRVAREVAKQGVLRMLSGKRRGAGRADTLSDGEGVGGLRSSTDSDRSRSRPARRIGVRVERVRATGPLDNTILTRLVRRRQAELSACYGQALRSNARLAGRITLQLTVRAGMVGDVVVVQNSTGDATLTRCLIDRARRWRLPSVPGVTNINVTLGFTPPGDTPPPPSTPPPPPPRPQVPKPSGPAALTGKLAGIDAQIRSGRTEAALAAALRWRAEQPGDVKALLGLGEALQARGKTLLAARVYGSIIDLFPSRADMRRFAGERLESLGEIGVPLAADTYAQAVQQRPDHQSGHRLLAYALARLGNHEAALAALEKGIKQRYRIDRSETVRIMREDIGIIAAALAAKKPATKQQLIGRLEGLGIKMADKPSTRFVLNWETDANDVDFHIWDGQGGHAYYSSRTLPSGGVLFGDVTNGYGPECFAIEGQPTAFPYTLRIHYYSRGPMGYGMGKLQILRHDGRGGLMMEDRPFVAMNDGAYVDLGTVKGPGGKKQPPLEGLPH